MNENKKEKEEVDAGLVELIFQAMCLENVSIIDAAKLSLIFSHARTADEIRTLIHVFSADYPFLAKIIDSEAEEVQENQEKIIEDFIRQCIKDNPSLGSQVAQAVSQNKDITISELS